MRRFFNRLGLMAGALMLAASPAFAAVKVFASVPEWAALAAEIGGDKVSVFGASSAQQDPHRIEARPSLIARARSANLVVATGAELEIGWLPLVLRESGNAAIQPGQAGYFEAASVVRMLEVPTRLDRAEGDVHPAGNPHFQLDPRIILRVGEALSRRLAELDPANASAYRSNYAGFAERWRAAEARWERQAAPLRGVPVWVQHRNFAYLSDWLGLKEVGSIEAKPGVEPGSAQLAAVLARQQVVKAKMVLRPNYTRPTSAQWLAQNAGIALVELPSTVGGSPAARDLFALFDDIVQRLLAGLK
ncbi:MAG: zinc ABC transporter solute-binding protein [Zoogloea sp.]|nr:zinc ABC transporter solute-binding protein [Zoogloea sp.]